MIDWTKAAKIAGMLGSDHDGEVVNAARKLIKLCKSIHPVVERIEYGGKAAPPKAAPVMPAKTAEHTRRCQQCGEKFIGKRTAKYCSDACRMQAYRKRM